MERRMVLRFLLASASATLGMSVSSSRAFFSSSRDFIKSGAGEAPSAAVATDDDVANAKVERVFIRRRRRCYYYRRYGTIRRRCVD